MTRINSEKINPVHETINSKDMMEKSRAKKQENEQLSIFEVKMKL